VPIDESRFAADYGHWALIAGGSDGLGAAFAEEIARRGVNLLLVARRQGPLDTLAADLRGRHGIEVRTLSLDLGAPDAAERLDAETESLKLGLVVFNAGAEASGALFHDAPYESWRSLIQRNILFLTEALHRFGERLREQGRGGLIVVGSEAAFGGAARGALYTASKGYALNLCESLWAELGPHGVHVQTLLFKIADTPTLREVLARKNIPIEATGAVSPARLARETIAALPDGPLFNFDEEGPDDPLTSVKVRRARVMAVSEQLEGFYAPAP
jgi:short-subunit dehydrogenase